MKRPTSPPSESRRTPLWRLLFLGALLLPLATLSVPLPFDPCQVAFCDSTDEEDDSPETWDDQAEVSSTPRAMSPTLVPMRMPHRHRLVRGLRLGGGNGRLGHSVWPARYPLESLRAHSVPLSPGGEHSRRNGLGAPLRC